MAKLCRAFRMDDPKEAAKHIEQNWEHMEGYGDSRYGNELYVWDDGGRSLGRCRECGAFILRQYSSYHGMESDGHYTDFFPVVDAAEDVVLDEVIAAMESKPEWADGLPLKAAGYECAFYKKD